MDDFIKLPDQAITGISEPPSMDDWREAMQNAGEAEALRLRAHAIGNLSNFPDGRWSPYVDEAESILRERGILC